MPQFQNLPIIFSECIQGLTKQFITILPGDPGKGAGYGIGEKVPVDLSGGNGFTFCYFHFFAGIPLLALQMFPFQCGNRLKQENPEFEIQWNFRSVFKEINFPAGGSQYILNHIFSRNAFPECGIQIPFRQRKKPFPVFQNQCQL